MRLTAGSYAQPKNFPPKQTLIQKIMCSFFRLFETLTNKTTIIITRIRLRRATGKSDTVTVLGFYTFAGPS